MALSGNFKASNATYGVTLAFYWNVVEQSTNDNTSTVSWRLVLESTTSNEYQIDSMQILFDQKVVSSFSNNYYKKEYKNGDVIASDVTVIPHESDGTKVWDIWFTANFMSYNVQSTTQHIVLNNISQALSKVSVISGTIGAATQITVTRANSDYTHTLEYAFGDLNETIAEKIQDDVIIWTIPESFYYQIPDRQYGTGEIYCYTYNGSKLLGVTQASFRATAGDASKPVVSVTFEETDAKVDAVSASFLQFVSDVYYEITAVPQKGASIVSYYIRNGQTTLTTATGTFVDVTDSNYEVIVTDSRGMVTSQTLTQVTNGYTKLTCNAWLKEVDPEDGVIKMGVSGNYFNRTFYNTIENSLTLRMECVDKDGNVITKNVTPTFEEHTYEAEVEFADIDYRAVYNITGYASDKLMDAVSQTVSVTSTPIFDWSNEDFRFNVPVTKVGEYEWADFVIEIGETSMGSNGKWYWRKWKSGRAECYGSRNFGRLTHNTQMIEGVSGWKRTAAVFDQSLPSGLFIDMPEVIDIRLKYGGKPGETASTYGGMVYLIGEGVDDNWKGQTIVVPSKDNTGSFVFIHPIDTSSYPLPATHVGFNIIGRWK